MARAPAQIRHAQALINQMEPALRAAFLEGVNELRSGVAIGALVAALRARDIERAIQALNIEPAAFAAYEAAKTQAYMRGGQVGARTFPSLPGGALRIRFDVRNPRAEQWIAENVGRHIVGLTNEQIAVARARILAGYELGQGPNQIATSLAGRIQGGRRVGGALGLSDSFSGHVESMRSRLASGDADDLARVLGMERRDRRYDALIRRHMESGMPLSSADIEKLTGRYSDRLLSLRAETVARTETGQAVMSARAEAFHQGLEKTGYPEEAVTRKWRHGGGGRDPRLGHIAMSNTEVRGLTQPFMVPNERGGVDAMMHPLDPDAPVSQTANCTCDAEWNVDYSYGLE